ncbi:MAG: chloride channel protein [Ruminococcaceae bacterium]|nr:chloride channel protein [Oscillospiraceae bacterium]
MEDKSIKGKLSYIKSKINNLKEKYEYIKSVITFFKWLFLSTSIGIIVGGICSLFAHTLEFAVNLRGTYPKIILLLPFFGLLIVFLYKICKDDDDKGTNTIVASIQESSDIPFKMAPLIFISTVITQLAGGSAGREGAAVQLGGSIAKRLGKTLKLSEDSQRGIILCGMSAGFSALFGTPMAAAIFSLEVISVGIMHYSALVPCVTASLMAHFVAEGFNVEGEKFLIHFVPMASPENLFKIALFAVIVGGISSIFCIALHKVEHIFEKYIRNQYLRIFIGGCLVIILCVVFGTEKYLGSGMEIIEFIYLRGEAEWYSCLLKILFTAVTIGAGFKGGEIVPSLCIGACLGVFASDIIGMHHGIVMACGMVGLFCGVTNCPLTSLLLAFELFGVSGAPFYLVTVAVSYMVSGSHRLYKKQQILYSKTATNYDLKE